MARKTTRKAAAAPLKVNESSNVLRSQLAAYLGKSHNGLRNVYQSFGYPTDVTTQDLWAMYRRNDIAARIIRAFPSATWRDPPIIRDEQGDSAEAGTKGYSAFVEAVEDYFDRHKLWAVLQRADRLASIGRYGVLFLGFDDDAPPRTPIPSTAKLLFAQPYGELGITISKYVTNVKNPRFGLPELYTLNAAAGADVLGTSPKRSIVAHHSRVLHLSEFLDQDEVFGVPRLECVYNRLKDLEKVVGGSAEAFWLNATRILNFSADPETTLGPDAIQAIKEQAEELTHQLRRWTIGQGITLDSLGAEAADPEPNVTTLLDLIAGATGVPKRILVGTERGELSSAQDENNWSSRIDERRTTYVDPNILRPFVNKLIAVGELPQPKGNWWVEWPENDTQDPVAASTISMNRATALATYANSPGAELVVPPQEFRKDILGLTPESDYDVLLPEEVEEIPEPDKEVVVEPTPAANMEAKTVYVRRDVLNVSQLAKWAKKQGLQDLDDGLHVTIMYCKKPIDWAKLGSSWNEDDEGKLMVHPGGPRQVNTFSPKFRKPEESAVVLEFACDGLEWRHREMCERGAVHSYKPYRPHVTLFYTSDPNFDVSKIEPYTGAIALGPEIWEEVKS